jgi:outer membrane receptor for ferrienterochelin and colicin
VRFLRFAFILSIVVGCLAIYMPVFSGETGILQGIVYDKDTGEVLPGANIKIESAMLLSKAITTVTNLDGKFIMTALAPGKYDVTCFFLGYTQIKVTEVEIRINRTSSQDFYLTTEEVLKKEIEVTAQARPIVDKDKSATTEIIGSDYIEDMPLEGRAFQQVLQVLPGVFMDSDQQIHIRGGQSGTVGWNIDGISSQDPRTGGYFNINMSAVEEIEVITGGADAKYGNNMSGQVNVVTKSGSDTYHGSLEFNYQNNEWYGSKVNNISYNPIFTLGGPIIKDKITFFASIELEDKKSAFPSTEYDQEDWMSDATWNELNVFTKATYQMTPDDKWIYSYRYNNVKTRNGSEATKGWRLPVYEFGDDSHSLEYIHLFTGRTNIFFNVTHDIKHYSILVQDDDGNYKDWTEYKPTMYFYNDSKHSFSWDDRLLDPLVGDLLGDYRLYYWDKAPHTIYTFRLTTADILENHYFEIGGELNDYRIVGEYAELPYYAIDTYDYIQKRIDNPNYNVMDSAQYATHLFYNQARLHTSWFSTYLQDAWDLSEDIKLPITMRPGIRFDYDEFTSKAVVSPRFGMNYNPNEKTLIRLHYGWFFQSIPNFYYMYPDRVYRYELSTQTFINPDGRSSSFLRPGSFIETTMRGVDKLRNPVNIAYEIGVDREVTENTKLTFNFFYKDMKDHIDEVDTDPDPSITRLEYINVSKSWAKGFEIGVEKRLADNWESRIGYTYIESKTTGVDQNGQLVDELSWVDWDSRHSGTLALLWQGPWDFTINTFYVFRTGLPYSPQRLEKKVRASDGSVSFYRIDESINTARWPDSHKVDVTFEKLFTIFKDYKLVFSLQVYNIFDRLNPTYNIYDIDQLTGEVLQWGEGRTMQFGARFEF